MDKIIPAKRSIIVAADVTKQFDLINLAAAVKDIPGIGGFKLGFSMAYKVGMKFAVDTIKHNTRPDMPVIFDHQKGGNDIPDTGWQFATVLRDAGVDAVILFPFTGPATQHAWTKSCQNEGLRVMVGGIMTHPKFLASEGGYIKDESVEKIYRNACDQGVTDFVVPGNKIEWVRRIRRVLTEELGGADGNFTLYAPGFISQKGDITECGEAAGGNWHAIVGSAIYKQPNQEEMRKAALAVTRQII